VTISKASGPGTLGGTLTVQAQDGVATFSNLTLDIAGTYKLSATDGGLVAATSTNFKIAAAAVANLAFIQGPSSTVAGKSAPPITVLATNAYGNVVSGESITLSVASGPGSLVGKLTATSNGSGIATFSNAILDTAGSCTLEAADSALASSPSAVFTISPDAASQLVFTQVPNSVTDGSSFTVQIAIEDQFGNVVTSDNTTIVSLALETHPAGPNLDGVVMKTVVNGLVTVDNLSLTLAGTYKLKAADTNTGLATVTSAALVVS
jgi:hypothetical protein